MMARKNGRQYQFICHKLSISCYVTTDCPLVGFLVCSRYYFCFQAALRKMKEPLCLALLIKSGHKKGEKYKEQ